MRAVLINAPGAPGVLTAAEVPLPALTGPSDVLVKLHAAGVNPIDIKVRKANMYYPDQLPSNLGCDGVGVVETVGSSVTRVRTGDEVFFFNNGLGGAPGNYAEYAVVHEDYLALKPGNLSMVEAAAVPLALITSWEALINRGNLKEGQVALVHAGAGGVGHLAIQLARYLQARVATTISNDEKANYLFSELQDSPGFPVLKKPLTFHPPVEAPTFEPNSSARRWSASPSFRPSRKRWGIPDRPTWAPTRAPVKAARAWFSPPPFTAWSTADSKSFGKRAVR